METKIPDHPAKFSQPVLERLDELTGDLPDGARILDPFAGVGLIHTLAGGRFDTVGVELEPEWAAADERTLTGNSRHLTALVGYRSFDAVVTSPAYGNRMADKYQGDPKGSRRRTYTISLGRPLSEDSGAAMHWRPGRGGDAYRELHRAVWEQCYLVLKAGGLMLLNVSDHIRGDQVMPVVEWHRATLAEIGFEVPSDVEVEVETKRMLMGANREKRVPSEAILVATKPHG